MRTVFVGKIRHVEVIKEGEATDGHGKEWRKDDHFLRQGCTRYDDHFLR